MSRRTRDAICCFCGETVPRFGPLQFTLNLGEPARGPRVVLVWHLPKGCAAADPLHMEIAEAAALPDGQQGDDRIAGAYLRLLDRIAERWGADGLRAAGRGGRSARLRRSARDAARRRPRLGPPGSSGRLHLRGPRVHARPVRERPHDLKDALFNLYRDDPASVAAAFDLARSLEAPARRIGLVPIVYNGELVLRGPGQWRVWTAGPAPRGWLLLWEPSQGKTPSTIAVSGPQAAHDMIAAWCTSEWDQRRRVRLKFRLPAKAAPHRWTTRPEYTWTFCEDCGAIQRADGLNRPCVGPARLSLRSDPEETAPRAPGCLCHLEEGDSPCPVHGDEE